MTAFARLAYGAAAGAAGTTALNAVTYLDMAVRARPSSSTPQEAVDQIADKVGHPVPGEGDTKENRLAGMGPLTGIATGVAVGVVAALLAASLDRLPGPAAAAIIGVTAMIATDGPLASLGLTEPAKWSGADWVSDLVPHLAYGAATYASLRAMTRPDHH